VGLAELVLPELGLPELSPLAPLEPLSPLEELASPELAPDATPLAEDPLGASAHAQTRQHAAARHAERRRMDAQKDCRFKR